MGLHTTRTAILCFAAAALVAVLSLAATPATAQRSLECQRVWAGPSVNNDFLDCLGNQNRIGYQWKYYVYPGFAAVIFLFTLIGVPIIFCCRCCCCERCCTSCTTSDNPARSRCWLWMWTVIAILWACCVCVLIIFGVNLMADTANDTLDEVRSGPLQYFNNTKNEIVTLLTDYSQDPPAAPAGFDLSEFDKVVNEFDGKLVVVKNDYFKYFKIARIVASCVGAVGVALMLMIILFACCQCNGCCPVCFSVIYWVFAIIFALLAILFTVGLYASGAACGEVTLQYNREPGILQWYIVPWCESEFDFSGLRDEIEAEVQAQCVNACDQLLTYCDLNDAYVLTDPDRIFVCGNRLSSSAQCTTLDFVADTVLKSYAKPMLSNLLCSNTTGWTYQQNCTVTECQTRCEDIPTLALYARTWSGDIVNAANYALNVSTALSYVMPMMDCNFIIDRVASAIETEESVEGFALSKSSNVAHCSNLHAGMIMTGTGFFVGALMFLMGIYILHAGSWMWGSKPSDEKADAESEESHKDD